MYTIASHSGYLTSTGFDSTTPALLFCDRDAAFAYRDDYNAGGWVEHLPNFLPGGYRIERYRRSRFYALIGPDDQLIALTVYKKGAANVARLLAGN